MKTFVETSTRFVVAGLKTLAHNGLGIAEVGALKAQCSI
jgi:hypothetical protein